MNVLLVSLRNIKVHRQKNTFILRQIVANLCDMAYKKFLKFVVLKEVCLRDPTCELHALS